MKKETENKMYSFGWKLFKMGLAITTVVILLPIFIAIIFSVVAVITQL